MNKRIALFLLLLLTVVGLQSQSVKTGLPFLKTGADARSTAMGEASVALTDDHSTFFYNPASVRFADQRQFAVSHRQGFSETSSDYIGATMPRNDITFALSAYTTSIDEIEVRLRPGDAEGIFSARNGALGIGAAISLSNDLAFGVAGKLLYEKIYIDEASGYGIDAGVLYNVNSDINAGFSIVNLGSMSVLRGEKSVLPTTVRFGGSYRSILSESFGLVSAADIVKTLDDELIHFHAGAEVNYDHMVMLRAGYQTGYEIRSFSAGAGAVYGILRVDYAFVPMSGVFSPNHTFSLTFHL